MAIKGIKTPWLEETQRSRLKRALDREAKEKRESEKLRPLDKYGRPIVPKKLPTGYAAPTQRGERAAGMAAAARTAFTQTPGGVVSSGAIVRARRQAEKEALLKRERERLGVVPSEEEQRADEEADYQRGRGRRVSEEKARFDLETEREEAAKKEQLSNWESAWETISTMPVETMAEWQVQNEATQIYQGIEERAKFRGHGGDRAKTDPIDAQDKARLVKLGERSLKIQEQKQAAATSAEEAKVAEKKAEKETAAAEKKRVERVKTARARAKVQVERLKADLVQEDTRVEKLRAERDKAGKEHAEALAEVQAQNARIELFKDDPKHTDYLDDATEKKAKAEAMVGPLVTKWNRANSDLGKAFVERKEKRQAFKQARQAEDSTYREEEEGGEEAEPRPPGTRKLLTVDEEIEKNL